MRRQVSKKPEKLARAFVDKAVAGNSSSTNIVLKVLDDQVEDEALPAVQQMQPLWRCPAERLAKEELWEGLEKQEQGRSPQRPRVPEA